MRGMTDVPPSATSLTSGAQERQDWEIRASVAHDILVMVEQDLAEVAGDAAYYRTMVTEIEDDLGDKAEVYEAILSQLAWEEDLDEAWDEDELEDLGGFEFEELGDEVFDLFSAIPFMDDGDEDTGEEENEDDQTWEEASS